MKELYEIDKIPPQAIELEEAVLGAMLIDQSCIDVVMSTIPIEAFYRDNHRVICNAIFTLKRTSKAIDLYTVSEQLKTDGKLDIVGGPYFLTQLTNKVAGSYNTEYHCKVLLDKYLSRELIRISTELNESAYNQTNEPDELITNAQKSLTGLMDMIGGNLNRNLLDIITESLDQIEMARSHPEEAFGVPTPLAQLNTITNGWQKSDLIILAGRPSRGKTAFALANVRSACEAGKSVLVFSLEMKDTQLMKRLIWSHDVIPNEAGGKISRWKLDIDQRAGIDVNYITSNCRAMKRTKGLDLVVIDYLQLMKLPKGDNRTYQIGDVTNALKTLAKDLDIPVILLSQLNRDIERRTNREPEMSDLRESGNIEQDADVVLFVSRPIMDGIEEDKDGNSTELMTVLKLAKHRNGKCPVRIKARNNAMVNFYSDWDETTYEYQKHIGGSQPDKF